MVSATESSLCSTGEFDLSTNVLILNLQSSTALSSPLPGHARDDRMWSDTGCEWLDRLCAKLGRKCSKTHPLLRAQAHTTRIDRESSEWCVGRRDGERFKAVKAYSVRWRTSRSRVAWLGGCCGAGGRCASGRSCGKTNTNMQRACELERVRRHPKHPQAIRRGKNVRKVIVVGRKVLNRRSLNGRHNEHTA